MRFLIAFAAILAYASASAILPVAYHANPGDVQAAVIDANVHAQDTARAIHEGQTRAAEAYVQHNTEAVRQASEAARDINENAYWSSVSASQTAKSALDGHLAAAAPHAYGYAAPLAYAGHGYAGHGYAGLGYAAHGYAAPLAYAAPGHLGYGVAPYGAVHAW